MAVLRATAISDNGDGNAGTIGAFRYDVLGIRSYSTLPGTSLTSRPESKPPDGRAIRRRSNFEESESADPRQRSGNANGPFVTAENIANATQKVTETLGFKSPGMFFQPPERVAIGAKAEPEPSVDPAVTVAQAQIEIARQAAAADADIKRMKAAADIEIAQWKARQWAEIERYKVGLKAEVDAISNAAADSACPERSRGN